MGVSARQGRYPGSLEVGYTTIGERLWPKRKLLQSSNCSAPPAKRRQLLPVGPALGPHGVSAPMFCQQFNDRTKNMEPGLVIPAIITIYQDKSFTFILKTPPASVLIKKACGIEKGSALPQKDKVAKLSKAKLEEIAKLKLPDLNANDLEAAKRIIAGTARAMGVEVEW